MDISRSSPTTCLLVPLFFSFLKKRGRGGRRGGKNFEGRDEIFHENFPFPITDCSSLFEKTRENFVQDLLANSQRSMKLRSRSSVNWRAAVAGDRVDEEKKPVIIIAFPFFSSSAPIVHAYNFWN